MSGRALCHLKEDINVRSADIFCISICTISLKLKASDERFVSVIYSFTVLLLGLAIPWSRLL